MRVLDVAHLVSYLEVNTFWFGTGRRALRHFFRATAPLPDYWRLADFPVVISSTATQAVFTDQISAEYEVQLAAVERDCLLSIDVA
jgi:hypothetical protein